MMDFAASIHPLGWLALIAVLVALVSLPQALREMWRRPWKDDARRERGDGSVRPDHAPANDAPGGRDGV
ncbi:hypothetical protein ACK8OR_16160 [Jannaschia sp. KMU-145]|uniref:hypothetical protein n=1 Tax=Jannaschia halovivens TaxID=3388667 RepID=UPI00396B2856